MLVVLLGGGAGAFAKVHGDRVAADHHAAVVAQRAKQKRLDAVQQKAQAQAAAAPTRKAEIIDRKDVVKLLRHSVKKSARKYLADGLLSGGPIRSVSCTPVSGSAIKDLSQEAASFQCFAANKKNADGSLNGYNFDATIKWGTGEYTWKLGT